MCAKHYNAWRKLNADDPCVVCATTGGDGRATQRGLCGNHYLVWHRAKRELAGFRARPSSRANSGCRRIACGAPREAGSYFCSSACREAVRAWAPDVFNHVCKSCLGHFQGPARTKFCNSNCRSFAQHVRRKFGLTIDVYAQMVRAPHVVCGICDGRPTKRWLTLDHDHQTGKIRGPLCDGCNLGLGHASDSATILIRLLEYLTAPPPLLAPRRRSSRGTCRLCDGPCTGAWATRDYCGQQCYDRSLSVSKYGLSVEMYRALGDAQSWQCAGCDAHLKPGPERAVQPNVDHCHTSGRVRGLLCNSCNACLGMFRENTTRMQRALDYLELHAA